jgi:hypothetical protein
VHLPPKQTDGERCMIAPFDAPVAQAASAWMVCYPIALGSVLECPMGPEMLLPQLRMSEFLVSLARAVNAA